MHTLYTTFVRYLCTIQFWRNVKTLLRVCFRSSLTSKCRTKYNFRGNALIRFSCLQERRKFETFESFEVMQLRIGARCLLLCQTQLFDYEFGRGKSLTLGQLEVRRWSSANIFLIRSLKNEKRKLQRANYTCILHRSIRAFFSVYY